MSRRGRKPKGQATPFDQIKELAPEWAGAVLTKSDEDLKNAMVNLELENKLIGEAKKADPDIPVQAEKLKTLRDTYNEPLKIGRIKMRVIAILLEERGKA